MRILDMPPSEYNDLLLDLHRWVEGRFARSGNTAFPTVRDAAKRFRIRQEEVEILLDDHDGMWLAYPFVDDETPLGDYYIESGLFGGPV